jgi:hypothetical protein
MSTHAWENAPTSTWMLERRYRDRILYKGRHHKARRSLYEVALTSWLWTIGF